MLFFIDTKENTNDDSIVISLLNVISLLCIEFYKFFYSGEEIF